MLDAACPRHTAATYKSFVQFYRLELELMENPSGKNEFPIILKKLVGKFIRERSISGDLIKFQRCVQKLCDKNWLNYFGRISLTVSSLLLWCGRLGGMETWRK